MIGYILLGSFTGLLLYKNFKGKKIVKQLKLEILNTHDYYREKYDYYLNFKDRYQDALKELESFKKEKTVSELEVPEYNIPEIKVNTILSEKPKRSRKVKTV